MFEPRPPDTWLRLLGGAQQRGRERGTERDRDREMEREREFKVESGKVK